MLRNRLINIYLLLLFVFASCKTSETDLFNGKHFIWQVDYNGNTLYLLGSIHIAPADFYPLPNVIEQAYLNTQNIAVEFDISSANPMELMGAFVYDDGTKLKDKLSEQNYNQIMEILSASGMPDMMTQSLRPFYAVMLAQQVAFVEMGFSADNGIDMHFINKAKKDNKKVYELESLESQIKTLSAFDDAADEFMTKSLAELEQGEEQLDEMFDAWKAGDAKRLDKFVTESMKGYPELEKANATLLDDRNVAMTKKIEQWLNDSQSLLVIVGSAHLVGDNGIVKLLAKSNKYTIKQL